MATVILYNAALLIGVACVSVGSGLQFGMPIGLCVFGAQAIGLTLYMIRTAR